MWHTSRGNRTLRGAEATLISAAIDVLMDELLMSFDDRWEEDPSWECQSGVLLFDSLTAPQRIGLLRDVARHLLTETPETLRLTAESEATVAAIFTEIRDQVAIEIDLFPNAQWGPGRLPLISFDEEVSEDASAQSWRQLVLAAADQVRAWESVEDWSDGVVEQPCLPAELGSWDDDRIPEVEFEDDADELRWEFPHASCPDIDQWEQLVDYLADFILWDRDYEMAGSFLDADPRVSEHRRRLMGIDDEYFTRVSPDPRPREIPRLISETRSIVRRKPR
jgi:hypothetical protein